jgi:ABC-2 type transport system permease protein
LSKLLAFIKRDILVAMSYRFDLLLRLLTAALSLLILYFVSRVFGTGAAQYIARYGGDYFPYVVIGVAVSNFVTVGLDTLSDQVRSAQLEGTLEALMGTPTWIYTILVGNSLSTFLAAFASAIVLVALGFLFAHVGITVSAALAAMVILLLTLLAFLSLGMLSAGFIMVFKRGNPIGYVFGWSSFFLGGIFFPVEILPAPIQVLSRLLPATHATRAIRELLLARAPLLSILPSAGSLLLFILVLAPLGIVFFSFAVRRAKREGSLVQY